MRPVFERLMRAQVGGELEVDYFNFLTLIVKLNHMWYGRALIILINVIIIVGIVDVSYFSDNQSEYLGVALMGAIAVLFFYNIYALIVYKLFYIRHSNGIANKIVFLIILLIPFILIWQFLS